MNDNVSKRLKAISTFVPQGDIVADIGSDHAYLPVYLIETGVSPSAIAGDVNEGPLSSAKVHIIRHHLQSKIKAKLGNGLAVLDGEQADTVVIAGMGGPLIAKILDEGKDYLSRVSSLVLQPNVAADRVRLWLYHNGWKLTDEAILEEDGHVYEIMKAVKGDSDYLYEADFDKQIWLGPFLLQNKNTAFYTKWERELVQLQKIDDQLNRAKRDEDVESRKRDVERKITWLKEELQ